MEKNNNAQRKRLIITGGDSRYFPLLQELIASLKATSFAKNIDIACLDGGLNKEEKEILFQQNILIKSPLIPPFLFQNPFFKRHLKSLKKRPNLAINLSKLWLDQIFPDYDTLLWLDSDIWVQEGNALRLFFAAAEEELAPLAIVPEIFTHKPFRLRWLPFGMAQIRSILYKNARIARIPFPICKEIGTRPTLNSGAFALSTKAPHWARFRFWQEYSLKYGKIFSADQLSKALCIYHERMTVKFLPVKNNYMGPWRYHSKTHKLCEDFYPHKAIGLIHLAGLEETRLNPHHQEEVLDEKNQKIFLKIRYSQFSQPKKPREG